MHSVVIMQTGNKKLENFAQLAAEYGFFLKMAAVTIVVLAAGFFLRKPPASTS